MSSNNNPVQSNVGSTTPGREGLLAGRRGRDTPKQITTPRPGLAMMPPTPSASGSAPSTQAGRIGDWAKDQRGGPLFLVGGMATPESAQRHRPDDLFGRTANDAPPTEPAALTRAWGATGQLHRVVNTAPESTSTFPLGDTTVASGSSGGGGGGLASAPPVSNGSSDVHPWEEDGGADARLQESLPDEQRASLPLRDYIDQAPAAGSWSPWSPPKGARAVAAHHDTMDGYDDDDDDDDAVVVVQDCIAAAGDAPRSSEMVRDAGAWIEPDRRRGLARRQRRAARADSASTTLGSESSDQARRGSRALRQQQQQQQQRGRRVSGGNARR